MVYTNIILFPVLPCGLHSSLLIDKETNIIANLVNIVMRSSA